MSEDQGNGPAKRKQVRNAPGERSFSITLSDKAHENLRRASDSLGVGQKHVLSFLLEHNDFSAIQPRIDEMKRKRELERLQSKVAANDVLAYLGALSPEERAAFLAKLNQG